MNNAARIVSDALLGLDRMPVIVAGRRYDISPPTIGRMAGAARHLSWLESGKEMNAHPEEIAKALSWFIAGNESLADELSEGTFDECLTALQTAYDMISAEGFRRLSALARNVAWLAAKPR